MTVTFTPNTVQSIEGLRQFRDPRDIVVGGNVGVIGLPPDGDRGLVDIRWVQSPHVAVMVTARGAVEENDVRAMANQIRFAP